LLSLPPRRRFRAKSFGKATGNLDFQCARFNHQAATPALKNPSKTRQTGMFRFRPSNVYDDRPGFERYAIQPCAAPLRFALATCLAAFFATRAGEDRTLACGTDGDRASRLFGRRLAANSPGTPISFRQEPAVLTADWSFGLTLRDFTVAGDVETLRVRLNYENAEIETFTRTETRDSAGRLVSVCNPTWPVATVGTALRGRTWGWDNPRVYWGEVLPEGVEPGRGQSIYLRIAPDTLPQARVVRVRDDLQYSGNVVNIVMPTFADGFPEDEYGFDLRGAAQRFYRDFEDTYEDLAMVTQDTFITSYGGFHRNVRNEVRGIGLDPWDDAATYRSISGRLKGVELYPTSQFTLQDTSSHEIAHQWGDYVDWTRLTGIVRSGWVPSSHDPLWAEGETLIGAVLSATRRVARADEGWQIQQTPGPVLFHPFTLYAMGLLPKEKVPEITLFDEQVQFSPTTTATPSPGRLLTGATRTATVYNVIGMLGERTGPAPAEWNRATIVVSRNSLASQREMDYWNYFSYRLTDPRHTGVLGYQGVGSLEASTGGRLSLKTDTRPLAGERVEQSFDVDSAAFAARDVRDVIFDERIPMRYQAGDRIRWSGRVSAPDRSDIDEILIRFTRYSDGSTIRLWADVDSRSSFVIETTFEPKDRGIYRMEVFLFWPTAGTQSTRASLSPVFID
jgi:hypothetical protein